MIESRLVALADRFWVVAGGRPAPPCDLQPIIARTLPLTVVMLPDLTLNATETWLRQRGLPYRAGAADRRLRGCLVAARGHGFIFVNESDPEDEQRFTLAHEVAHFLLDHQSPRADAIRRHGAGIVEVLNGERTPTAAERFDSALIGNDFVCETYLLERHGDAGARAAASETDADRLAWELLAPVMEVAPLIDTTCLDCTCRTVIDRYGLPPSVARRYVQALARSVAPPTFVDWLGDQRRNTTSGGKQ